MDGGGFAQVLGGFSSGFSELQQVGSSPQTGAVAHGPLGVTHPTTERPPEQPHVHTRRHSSSAGRARS